MCDTEKSELIEIVQRLPTGRKELDPIAAEGRVEIVWPR
jgi:hypothetical protein